MTTASTSISRSRPEDVSELHGIWEEALASLHKAYALPAAKFEALVTHPSAVTFVARDDAGKAVGFVLTYTIRSGAASCASTQHLKGMLSAVVVRPDAQRRGVGSALHKVATEHLSTMIRESFSRSTPAATESIIQLGSVFPRIFPGVPDLPAFKPAKAFFGKNGWSFKNLCIDLYGAVPTGVDQEQFKKQAHSHGIQFRPATAEDEDKIMELQKEFDSFTGWPDQFPAFIKAGKAGDIHLAINKHGEVIGATLAALAPSPFHEVMAWPDTLGKRCGGIACVGVSAKSRGEGAGVGMVASALQDLEKRGADGCFIDWVEMKGFYERFGLTTWEAPYHESARKVTLE